MNTGGEMGTMDIISMILIVISLLFLVILVRALVRFFVKKKVPTVSYTPYDDAMKGKKKE